MANEQDKVKDKNKVEAPPHITESDDETLKAVTGVATEQKLENDEHKNFQPKNRFDEAVHQTHPSGE